MADSQTAPTRLSNLQMELLKLYPYDVSDEEIRDIRKLLAAYFGRKVDDEMNELWQQKGWDEQTLDTWKNEHLRSQSS